MNPYESIRKWSLVLGFACGVAVDNALRRYALPNSSAYVTGVAVDLLAISLTTFVVQRLVQIVFGKWAPVRMLLLQKQFIEGAWVDMVILNRKVIAFGVVRFEPTCDSLRYIGENYAVDGCYVSSFTSEMIHIDWPLLKFKYRGVDRNSEHVFPEGFGELQFVTGSHFPERFTGYSVNILKGQKVVISGRRLSSDELQRLEGNAERRQALFSEYLASEGYVDGGDSC